MLLQNNEPVCILLLCITFVLFAKMAYFFRGGYVYAVQPFFTNCGLFFIVCHQIFSEILRTFIKCCNSTCMYVAQYFWHFCKNVQFSPGWLLGKNSFFPNFRLFLVYYRNEYSYHLKRHIHVHNIQQRCICPRFACTL